MTWPPPMGLSVLTLARGRRSHLRRQIEGLRRSALPPDELIIVDMGGPRLEYSAESFPIRVLPLQDADLPLAKARNLAASAARHQLLLFLDADCIPMTGLLSAMHQALTAHDALICPEIRYLPDGAIQEDWREDALMRHSSKHPARDFPANGVRPEKNPGLFWSVAFGISRSLYEKLGGFDERFLGYGAEDTDFGFSARCAGVELLFQGGAGAFHQHHFVCDPPLQHFEDIIRNAELFYQKWRVWPMHGWLDAFEHMGLIKRGAGQLITIRPPSASEIEAAGRPSPAPA